MSVPARIAGGIAVALACLVGLAGTAAASTLDPFRRTGSPGRASAFDPIRMADVAPAAGTTPAAAPPAAATPPAAAPAPLTCRTDDDCPDNNICESNVCQTIRTRTNIAYLYYREGSFREILLLYWSKRGPDGFTVLAPFYWHFWSPTSESRVVAPFYWRFEDRIRQSVTTVILPILPVSWSREPGASSFAIWPLFYTSSKLGWAVPLAGSYALRDPATGRSGGAVAFLYWWRRTPEKSVDLLIPLFFSKRSPERSFTWVLPLNFYWRTGEDTNTLVLPLFYTAGGKDSRSIYTLLGYYRRVGHQYNGAFAWFYWFGRNSKTGNGYDVVFPLVWNYIRRDGGTTVVPPLIWSFRGAASNTTVVFPFFHFRRGDSYVNTVFPIWWGAGNRKTGNAFQVGLPLYFWRRWNGGKAELLATPLGGYASDAAAGTSGWVALPLLSFSRHDPDSDLHVYSPFYVSHTSKEAHSATRLIGLLFYRRTEPEGSTTAVLPLFWHFRDAASGATASILLPIFARRSGPRDTTTIVLPFYWRRFTNGGWSGGVFPLAYFGDNAGRGHAVLFPLFWRYTSAGSSTTLAIPLFYWHRDSRGYDSAWLPLLFFGRHDGDSYAVQFPLFWHYASARAGTNTTATPLGFYHRDRDGWSAGVGPLLPIVYVRSGQDRSHFVLFPLFWHFKNRPEDKTTTVVGPYWHQRWGGETTDGLFPLLYYRRGARPGGQDETSFTLFPLVHYRRAGERRVFVTPVYGYNKGGEREAGFLLPYFWYRDKDLDAGVIPLLYADVTRKDSGERTRQFGPWFQVDAPGRSARVLFPLFGRYKDERETDTWVFPSYFRMRRTNGDKVDAFLPIYWRSKLGDRTTTVIGPFYDRTGPGIHNSGLVPFYFTAKNPDRTLTIIPPLLLFYHRDHKAESTWLWAALLYHTSDRNGSTTSLFPVLWSKRRGPRSYDVLFPIYWHFTDTEARTDWLLAGPFYSSTKGERRTRGILPIAWMTRDTGNGDRANAVLPLFYESKGKDHRSFLTVLAGYRRSGPSRFWYAFPFVFRSDNEATEETTTVIPPLLYVSNQTPDQGFTSFLALFWHRHDISSSTTLALPLFYDVHDYHLSRTTVMLPLFIRHERMSDGNTWWLAPLFYRHTTPTEGTTVAFPLYWDFRNGNNRTTVLFPFYAHWRRPDHASTYVFPLYYYREGLTADGNPDGTYRRFVIPFFDSGVKRPGDYMWEIFGGLVGQERIGRHHFLRLLYMTFETGPAHRAQTAWYSQPTRTSRRTPTRGLNVAGF